MSEIPNEAELGREPGLKNLSLYELDLEPGFIALDNVLKDPGVVGEKQRAEVQRNSKETLANLYLVIKDIYENGKRTTDEYGNRVEVSLRPAQTELFVKVLDRAIKKREETTSESEASYRRNLAHLRDELQSS